MGAKPACWLFALFMSLSVVTCQLFHDPSAVLLQPVNVSDHSDFGFAMGHWNGTLIVGAPRSNFFGEVYSCPVTTFSNDKKVNCSFLDLNFNASDYSLENNPNQKFHLGASIATTKNYFFTCAPLATKSIDTSMDEPYYNAFGSCFVYNGTSQQYIGPDERFTDGEEDKLKHVVGGTGWNTLADENNGLLIIAKTSPVLGDINYLQISDTLATPSSLLHQSIGGGSQSQEVVLNIHSGTESHKAARNVGYGLAAGTFFSKEIVYAFSLQSYKMNGKILFLKKKKSSLVIIREYHKGIACSVSYKPKVVAGMFGYTLEAVDLNKDGRSELLIGAPAQSEDKDEWEVGALHIYLGGDNIKNCDDQSRMRTIFGNTNGGRFGTAIAANDLDGDGIPEVFVSAPYEDTGVVYILSGYDLKRKLIRFPSFMKVQVSQLPLTQRVQRSDLQQLGFSLQVVPDVDSNGCDELAVGAPGSESVLLLRCVPSVNVSIESKLVGEFQFVRLRDDEFKVAVCVYIEHSSNSPITGHIKVINEVIGPSASIPEPNFDIDLSEDPEETEFCENIDVILSRHVGAGYKFITTLKQSKKESTDFKESGVVFSPYSQTTHYLDIDRHCVDDDCYPDLKMKINWHGKDNETYELGSSNTELVSVVVKNEGNTSYSACVRVNLKSGARIAQTTCSPEGEWLKCMLRNPLRQDDNQTINLVLNMTQLSNMDFQLHVVANLYEKCHLVANITDSKSLEIDYTLKLAKKNVSLDGVTHSLNITDKEVADEKIKSFKNDFMFLITNNGSIKWIDVPASILVKKQPFIEGLKIGTSEMEDCEKFDKEDLFEIRCNLTLPPDSVTKVIAWVDLSKKEVGTYFNKGQDINVTSSIQLTLVDNDPVLEKSLVTEIMLMKDLSFGNDRTLIIIAVVFLALFILGLLVYILYKNNFFKRKQKKRLDVLRDSVRRRSVRLGSVRQVTSVASAGNDEHMDLEVVEDSPFEEIPVTSSNDDTVLVEESAQVQCSESISK